MGLSVSSHVDACAVAARMLRHRMEAFRGDYPGVVLEDLVREAQHLAEELHEMQQLYSDRFRVNS